jgi:disulfide bond formation protein DsbB
VTRGLRHPDIVPALILLAVSAATLAIVYASQYIGGLQPCQLCLYQRWPWWGALALSALASLPALSVNLRTLLVLIAGLAILAGAGLAFYHVGIEQHWWPGPASCGAAGQIPGSFAQLQRLMQHPAPNCDQPAWTLLGISMAGYNAILSVVIGAWALVTAAATLIGKESVRPG